MHFICSLEEIRRGVSAAAKATIAKSPNAMYEVLLIQAFDGEDPRVVITGYSGDISIETITPAEVRSTGSVVVSARFLSEIIAKLDEQRVSFYLREETMMIIESGQGMYNIYCESGDVYPPVNWLETNDVIDLPLPAMIDMIRRTLFSASSETVRQTFSGCFFYSDGNKFDVVGIDGFRMALRRRRNTEEEQYPEMSFNVPGRTLRELASISFRHDRMKVALSGNRIVFATPSIRVGSPLISGDYINYESIIPQTPTTRMIVNRSEMLAAIERSLLIVPEDNRKLNVQLSTPDNQTLIMDIASSRGTFHESIRVDVTGELINLFFNPNYICEALRAIDEEKIEMAFTGMVGPTVFLPLEGDGWLYLLLPLRSVQPSV
ncbi:MAG: DNA polymerase III subunit beta [Clostridiaceae bacterium]|nr:DNA polymerase III subunit beta [Clostridiaceae bacterium]